MSDRITANLPAIDFDATEAFYARLGFETAFKDKNWMIMARGPYEIEFFPYRDLDPGQSSFSACLRATDLEGLWRAWERLCLPTQAIPRQQGPAFPSAMACACSLWSIPTARFCAASAKMPRPINPPIGYKSRGDSPP